MNRYENNKPWQHLYNYKWSKVSKIFLSKNPICVYCLQLGKTTPATLTDHIVPHKGNLKLFWDENNYQALCESCHNSVKKIQENTGCLIGCDADGFPLDPLHQWKKSE